MKKIHSCPNGCMLFWDDKEKDEVCSFCGSSRWKVYEASPEDEESPPKKKASKILRWFPLKPRLQRLFMSLKTSNLMKWHHTELLRDGKLRHPADALVWKDFDEKFPEFASDPRNVRLALSSDGFNPFRMNVPHSPKGPGNKIDVYMQPLIKELKELWEDGVSTFDASTKQYFQLKASIISTISDFPGYANLSGWSTKGALACHVCGFDTDSNWLSHGRKWCYMCHRRWLPSDHRWRSDTRSFVGHHEFRAAPVSSSGEEILQQLDNTEFLVDNDVHGPWKKKSIFFMLPYWEHLLLRHNLDVMHIEKNVCDNIVGTILGQEGKSKDNYKTRLYLQQMGIRKELHPKMKEPHVSGTKSFARLAHEMATKNNGIHPTRGEMYIKTRTRKDGSIVDDNATQASLKKITNDSTTTPDDPADFTNDDYSKVKGPEKRGYIRLVGRMPAAKSNATYSQTNDQIKSVIQTNDQLKSVVNAMAIIIQEHIPNANLSSVLSNINMQVPGTVSLVHNNSLSSSRSQYDNGQESRLDN
ncbi:putative transposase, Ptta/En/Spm, plant [Helianthus annuus]|nr:putative transposase, Ptta/En/Spm, plant [Helianthus annuus]